MTLEERFWAKVDRRGPDECWPWTGGKVGGGYGAIRRDGGGPVAYAHRVALELAGIDPGPETRHTCDNPPCVNTAHLLPGGHLENMRDMFSKGRRPTKLTRITVAEIRARYQAGERQTELAASYRVSQNLISQVVRREAWPA